MMALKASSYAYPCLLFVLLCAASLEVVVADANSLPSDFCDITPEPEFCEEIVNGAYNAYQATSRAIYMAIKKTKFVYKGIRKFISELPENLPLKSRVHVMQTCTTDFRTLLNNYTSALYDLDSGAYDKLKIAMTVPSMDNCVPEIVDLVINPGVVTRLMKKINPKKYGDYAALIADNLKPKTTP